MKNKKSVYALILVLIFLIYIIFSNLSFIGKDKIKTQNVLAPNPQTENKIKTDTSIPQTEKQVTPKLNTELNQATPPVVIEEKKIKITLNVLDKTYKANVKEGATLYDAMSNIQSVKENNFSFSGKEYSGLGYFVDEINGIKGTSGKYWIYYVNGKEASVGVSKYILKSEDIISWKQE